MDLIENYLQTIQEVNYIFSGKDNKFYNFDKWLNNENKILYIVGLSGSGKSTIGRELSNKYNTEYIELDEVDRQYRKKLSLELNKDRWDKEINQKVHDYLTKYLESLKKKSVVEGIHILYQDYEKFRNQSVIIVTRSLLSSSLSAYFRNVEKYGHKASRWEIAKDIYYNQKDFFKRLKKFEQFMKNEIGG